MVGKDEAKAETSARSSTRAGETEGPTAHIALKDLSFLPSSVFFKSTAIDTARSKNSATFAKSSSVNPREVRAGAPIRIPPGVKAEVSPGIVFLFVAMQASSRTRSTRAPSIPRDDFRSTKTKWLSVPPLTRAYPNLLSSSAKRALFFRTCFWYSTKSAVLACFKHVASAPIVWLCGPPCRPGKTAKLILSSMSYIMGLPFLSVPFCPLR
mmetsp:Transcript_7177/g.12489  ORF Transcript_7177/g.12489 Transcript_7177/m.12489 type:complete len:210 (+) Transcript_7177:160-789(+)